MSRALEVIGPEALLFAEASALVRRDPQSDSKQELAAKSPLSKKPAKTMRGRPMSGPS